MNYYTFRHKYDCVEATKWEENRSYPLESYELRIRKGVLNANMCSCPARTPCKHLKALVDNMEKVHPNWLWHEKYGWEPQLDHEGIYAE